MSSSIFAVILTQENEEITKKIEKAYPTSRQLNDFVYLVEGDCLAEDVAIASGIKGDSQVKDASGIVFKLNGAYSGFAPRTIWEWLSRYE